MAETPFPQVDYLSRDYTALRADLLDGIPSRLPEWTSRNQNDFGIVLLELFAYMGDGLHYYIDRTANEAFLATATQRSSVLSFARLLDYKPTGNQAATVSLIFANALAAPVVIPVGTRVSTTTANAGEAIYFETTAELTVPAASQASVNAVEGVTVSLETLGTSSGQIDQDFPLSQKPVIEGSVAVSVSEAAGTLWTYFGHLLEASPSDPAFTLTTDARDVTHVLFGDGVNGKVPAPGAPVRARYRVGGGVVGNVGPGQLTRIVTTVPAGVTVTNQTAAAGGVDAETLDQIKVNAPRSLYALERAVSPDDYATLATTVPAVAQARVVSTTPRVVSIFVVPTAGGPLPVALRDAVLTYLEPRKMMGTTVLVNGPDYVATTIRVTVHINAQFLTSRVQQATLKLLKQVLQLENVVLGDRLTVTDLYRIVGGVAGVDYLVVNEVSRAGVSPEPGSPDAVFRPHELPVEGLVVVNVVGGIGA